MKPSGLLTVTLVAAALASGIASAALYRWVDEKGRVQYSDKPPPSDQQKSGVELNKSGVVRKKLDTSLSEEEKKAREEEAARRRLEEQKAAERRRQDIALLQSYTDVKEIDLKRDREVQAVEASLANLRLQAKNVADRQDEDRKRADAHARNKKPLPDNLKDELARAEVERKQIDRQIADKQQEIVAIREKYDDFRKRFVELKELERQGAFAPPPPPPSKKK